MKARVLSTVLVLAVASSLVLLAGPALAACTGGIFSGNFKGYDQTGCNGTPFFTSAVGDGGSVNVRDNITSSGKNGTSNHWCGVNEGIVDHVVQDWPKNTDIDLAGSSANNVIDHFSVHASGC
jgi:hypothetical protein